MDKVLVFLPNSFTGNFAVVLDEIQSEINVGNEVYIIGCESSINFCEMNLSGSNFICKSCTHCLKHAIKYINGVFKYYPLKYFHDNDTFSSVNDNTLSDINSMEEFKTLIYDGYEIGYAVASTYISDTRNHNPRFSVKFKKFISNLYKDSIYIYEASKNAINVIKPDRIIIFNGRLHVSRPIVYLAESNNIHIDILEVIGGRGNKSIEKVKYENFLPHSIKNNTNLIVNYWEQGEFDKEEKGKAFFENRKKGIVAGDKVYTKDQQIGLLPDNFDKSKKNIAIFNSSEDEMAAIGKEWEWSFFGGNQLAAIDKILSLMTPYKDYFFYIRVHPNLKSIDYKYHTDYYLIENKYNNVKVIPADSEISSYAIIDSCDKVVTFGSSVGIEATYWEKPSILIGKSTYMYLDVTYNPKDESSLLELLLNDNLKPKSKFNTLKYGYFIYGRKGLKFNFFDPNNLNKPPTWLNTNLFLYNIDPNKKISINSLCNFLCFSTSRFLNHFVYNKNIPLEETQ